MRVASVPPAPERARSPLGRRTAAFLFVLAVHFLLALALLLINPEAVRKAVIVPIAVSLLPDLKPVEKPDPAPKRAVEGATRKTPARTPPVVPKPVEPPPKLFEKELFDAVDIAALPNHRGDSAAPGTGDKGEGADSQTAIGPGGGPHGETLYRAEWVREPTNAELAFYLPKTGIPPNAWAMIACRTVERFRVEDCQEIGDSPPGSRLAGAIREAAWQFRVRPPRVGGQTLVGAWVSIRIDFSKATAE